MITRAGTKLKRVALGTAQIGILLTLAFSVFQVTQSWVDAGISKPLLRWVFPLGLGLGTLAIGSALLLVVNANTRKENVPSPEYLASAILAYGQELSIEGRDQALIKLRNNFSATLHILGFHTIRTKLGELALKSASIVYDDTTKAEILVDDIGWANYLQGNEGIAVKNIERGVSIAAKSKLTNQKNQIRLALCEAKGLRHIANIIAKVDLNLSTQKLDEALHILESQSNNEILEVRRDIAEINFGKALVIATSLGIHKSGKLRPGDRDGFLLVSQALIDVRAAESIFQEIGDIERYVKALFLEVRLLEAMGEDTEAKEVAALRDRTLTSSEWIRSEESKTLKGV